MARDFLTIPEAARVLGVHRTTVLDMVTAGRLPAYRPTGPRGRYRVRLPDLIALIDAGSYTTDERARLAGLIATFTADPEGSSPAPEDVPPGTGR